MNPLQESVIVTVVQATRDLERTQISGAFGQIGVDTDTRKTKDLLVREALEGCGYDEGRDAHAVLGKFLKALFSCADLESDLRGSRIAQALAQVGLRYYDGHILGSALPAPAEDFVPLVNRCAAKTNGRFDSFLSETRGRFDALSADTNGRMDVFGVKGEPMEAIFEDIRHSHFALEAQLAYLIKRRAKAQNDTKRFRIIGSASFVIFGTLLACWVKGIF